MITPTHHYYRFKPKDSLQLETLLQDTVLNVSDIPFEYDVQTNGENYVDPAFDGSSYPYTYFYSVAPINYNLPAGIPVTKISKLHFTREDEIPDNPTPAEEDSLRFYEELSTIALLNAGYLSNGDLQDLRFIYNNNGTQETLTHSELINRGLTYDDVHINFFLFDFIFGRKWRPTGTVTVEEDVLVDIKSQNDIHGVKGAEIRVRKWGWLVIRKARTDENGDFSCRRTRTKYVKYSCYFNNNSGLNSYNWYHRNFTVKAGTFFWNAKHRGHRRYRREGWFQHFPETIGRSHFYALVQNAAYEYYHHIADDFGIWKPTKRTRINAKFSDCNSSQTRPRIMPWHSQVRVTRRNGNCTYRRSDGVFATTIHELTHVAHLREDTGLFWAGNVWGNEDAELMIESWAEGVETIVTNDRYLAFDNNYRAGLTDVSADYPLWNDLRQTQTVNEMDEYTPIVVDLIDNLNQNFTDRNFDGIDDFVDSQPIDRVRGYNLNQLQLSIDTSRSLEEWRNRIRTQHFNSTENLLDELFDYPIQVAANL